MNSSNAAFVNAGAHDRATAFVAANAVASVAAPASVKMTIANPRGELK